MLDKSSVYSFTIWRNLCPEKALYVFIHKLTELSVQDQFNPLENFKNKQYIALVSGLYNPRKMRNPLPIASLQPAQSPVFISCNIFKLTDLFQLTKTNIGFKDLQEIWRALLSILQTQYVAMRKSWGFYIPGFQYYSGINGNFVREGREYGHRMLPQEAIHGTYSGVG